MVENPSVIVSPVDTVTFSINKISQVASGVISIENLTDKPISYKLKSNANFKVVANPSSSGTLEPGKCQSVNLNCQNVDPQNKQKVAKFLVMWTSETPDDDSNPKTLWSKISNDRIHFVALKCDFQSSKPEPSDDESAEKPKLTSEVKTVKTFASGFDINFYGQVAVVAILGIIFGEYFFGWNSTFMFLYFFLTFNNILNFWLLSNPVFWTFCHFIRLNFKFLSENKVIHTKWTRSWSF